jgi:hypothetical protein
MIDSRKSSAPQSAAQAKRKEANPNARRVYINQRIPRIRDEMKDLQEELQDAHAGSGPKGAKASHAKIYARERMVVLRHQLKALIAERLTLPKNPGAPASPAVN